MSDSRFHGRDPTLTKQLPSAEAERDLPAHLAAVRRLLAVVRSRARRWIAVESLALVGLALAGGFWGSLLIDRVLEPPAWVRVGMMLACVAGLCWIIRRKLVDRLATSLSDASLALLVERQHPFFQDSLVTTVELGADGSRDRSQDDAVGRDPVNPGLLAKTAADAAAGLPGVRLGDLFRGRELATLLFSGIMAAGTVGLCALVSPETAGTWLRRVVLLDDTPWPRRTRLVAEDFAGGVRTVARGSDVDVVVAADTSMVVPELVEMRWRLLDNARSARMGRRGGPVEGRQLFGHVIERVTDDIVFSVRGGDARLEGLRLNVVDPPALAQIEIDYTLPAYLGSGQRRAAASGIVQVPAGSTVRMVCRSTKPCRGAKMTTTADGEAVLFSGFEGADLASDRIEGVLDNVRGEQAISISLLDTDGIANTQPIGFLLSAVPDEPPSITMQLRGISTAVTPGARVPLIGQISDDHALASVEVLVARQRPDASPAEVRLPVPRCRGGEPLVEFPIEAAEIVDLAVVEPTVGDTLRLWLTASDAAGLEEGPHEAVGDTWTLAVVTSAELSAMLEARELLLRRRFESMLASLVQARDAFEADRQALPARLGQAAARTAGETGEIAEAFSLIHLEFDNNGLLTSELDTRLLGQIARPLAELASGELPALVAETRAPLAADDVVGRDRLLVRTDAVLARLRAVLDRMMELETFNEVVDLLRSTISEQEEIRQQTRDIQKERARALLEEL